MAGGRKQAVIGWRAGRQVGRQASRGPGAYLCGYNNLMMSGCTPRVDILHADELMRQVSRLGQVMS